MPSSACKDKRKDATGSSAASTNRNPSRLTLQWFAYASILWRGSILIFTMPPSSRSTLFPYTTLFRSFLMSRKIILIKQELLLLVYELNRSGLLAENEKIRKQAVVIPEIGRAVQQECRDRSRMPSSA